MRDPVWCRPLGGGSGLVSGSATVVAGVIRVVSEGRYPVARHIWRSLSGAGCEGIRGAVSAADCGVDRFCRRSGGFRWEDLAGIGKERKQ